MKTTPIVGDVDYAAHGQGYGRQRGTDCVDGSSEAFCARPEAFLDPAVRRSKSAWSFVPEGVQARCVRTLGADLASGEWDRRHGAWRTTPFLEGGLRGIVLRAPR